MNSVLFFPEGKVQVFSVGQKERSNCLSLCLPLLGAPSPPPPLTPPPRAMALPHGSYNKQGCSLCFPSPSLAAVTEFR